MLVPTESISDEHFSSLTANQQAIIELLAGMGSASGTDLLNASEMAKGTFYRVLGKLTNMGLIIQDEFNKSYSVTTEGMSYL